MMLDLVLKIFSLLFLIPQIYHNMKPGTYLQTTTIPTQQMITVIMNNKI